MRIRFSALCIVLFFCLRANAAATVTWLQVSTPHFIVISDAGERQARHVAGEFERMQAVFQKLLPGPKAEAGSPIVVLAVKNRRDFQTLIPAAYLNKGSLDLAGLFLQSNYRNDILVRLDTEGAHPYSTVYHEYTHYITRHANLPVWLNEGIAEFYQNTDIDAREIRFGQPDANFLQLLRSQSLLPLPTLFEVDHDSPYYHEEQKGTMFYAESWALTYMLYYDDFHNKTKLIPNYINAVSAGQNSLNAATTAFGDLNKLQKGLHDLLEQSSFDSLSLATNIPDDEASYKVTPVTATDADAYRAAVLVSNDRSDDGQKLIDAVLAADPNNALAHESEGMLHLRERDLGEARKSYAEAVSLHSTSFLAWYYAAFLTLHSDDHDDAAIETDLEQCLKLNPDFAPANNALADYYAAGHKDLDQALTHSILAVTEEPDNLEYRLSNASLHVQREEIPSAIAVLEAARPIAHTPAQVEELDSRIEEIKRYQDELAAAKNPVAPDSTVSVISEVKTVTAAPAGDGPHYPDTPPSGPRHKAAGILHDVQCAYPTILTLTVDGGAKPIALYTNHMYKIDYWVTFDPKGGLDPCKIEGMKAVVTYTDSKDSRVAGQIVAIRISK